MGVVREPVQQRLERLAELARRTGGPVELEGLLDVFIGAFDDYAGGHAPSPGRLTDEQVEGLTEVGVNVEVVGGLTDPGAELAARETAVTSGALTAAEAAKRLGLSPTRVRQRLTSDPPTLIGRRVAGGEWRLPAFQFDRGNVVAEWGSEVIAAGGAAAGKVDFRESLAHANPPPTPTRDAQPAPPAGCRPLRALARPEAALRPLPSPSGHH